jgi:putative hemolysin
LDPDPFIDSTLVSTAGSSYTFYILGGLIILVLLSISALVSASEIALFSLNSKQLDELRHSSETRDEKLLNLLSKPRYLLSTILIWNNLVNVGIVTTSTFITWEATGTKDNEGITVLVLTFLVTTVIVFFGEITPKTYAYKINLPFARFISPYLTIALKIMKPVSWLLVNTSSLIEKRIQRKGYRVSVDELNHALEITSGKDTSKEEKEILKGIVNFGTISVKQIMRSRQEILAIDFELGYIELIKKVNEYGYSRMPVFKDTIDTIEGIIYIKDLLPYLNESDTFDWKSLIRPCYFIPESKKIDDLLKDFQEKRVHLAIVVDEYGGTSGLITLEDIIEEIVGEIHDEFDERELLKYSKLDERTYIFEAKTLLSDVCEVVGFMEDRFDPVRGEAESLGGLMLELFQRFPKVGDRFMLEDVTFTIVSVEQKKINKIKLELKTV